MLMVCMRVTVVNKHSTGFRDHIFVAQNKDMKRQCYAGNREMV